jgi:hypothetical protein
LVGDRPGLTLMLVYVKVYRSYQRINSTSGYQTVIYYPNHWTTVVILCTNVTKNLCLVSFPT